MSDLVNLTIDGVEMSVPKGTLVVDAAKRNTAVQDIPVFCYHPKLDPVGMCRMCLVQIGLPMRDRGTGKPMLNEDGSPQIGFRDLQTGCTVPVSEGMVVLSKSDPTTAARSSVIEFLLTNHPLDCPTCDKGGECALQDLTMLHGKGQSRVHFSDKNKNQKNVPLGDLIYLDRERCIQCARCIRFQEEIVDDPVIRFHNRGQALEIVTMSAPGFNSYWSGNTADICPVGALTTADFRFGARPWELTPAASLCAQCPVGCNTMMSTRREAKSGGRSIIKRILPRQNEAVNELWICDKGRFVHHFVESDERLTKPLLRKNGELAVVEWDEALNAVAEGLKGAATAVAGLSGGRLSNEDFFQFQKLFRKGLKSGNIDLANRRLGGGEIVAKVGISAGSDLQQLGAGDAILVAASDLHEEAPIWWMRVKQAADRGAKLVVFNARPTRLDKHAAHVVHYEAGMGLTAVRQLLNAAKVETAGDNPIAAAANVLINAKNLVVFYGYEGLTCDESDALAKLLANLLLIQNDDGEAHAGKPNNGLIPVWPQANTQGAWDMGVHPALLPGYKATKTAGLDAAAIYEGAANGKVKALYLLGADPVGDGLMSGRGKLGFLVVQELFMTKTAAVADVVLPAQSWAEREGTFTSGERRVQRYYPAVAPIGESRADWQILAQVGERVGAGKPAFAASLVFKEIVRAVRPYKTAKMDYRSLAQVEKQWPDLSGSDSSFAGTAYENTAGLGQQWKSAAESGGVDQFEASDASTKLGNGLKLINAQKLYASGKLIDYSALLAPRMAKVTAALNAQDAGDIADGDKVSLSVNGQRIEATAVIDDGLLKGTAVLSGVDAVVGTAVVQIEKIIN